MKYITNIEVNLLVIYTLNLVNAWNVEYIKISVLQCFVVPHRRSQVATNMQNFRTT